MTDRHRIDHVQVGDLHVTADGRTVRVTEIKQVDGRTVLYTEALDEQASLNPPKQAPLCDCAPFTH